jgi:hypothetical protein
MKIEGPSKTQGSSKSKKTAKTAAGGFGVLLNDGGVDSSSPSVSAQSLSKVDALLLAQATDDPAERAAKGRMTLRADRLLDELDNVRLSMLTGSMTIGGMIDLADIVASHKEGIDDPELSAILAEIDLRAQVEIAKMRVSLDALE